MKNHLPKTLFQGIKDLHIKILQSNNLPEIGNYLQEILDKVVALPPSVNEKLKKQQKDLSMHHLVDVMKKDIKSIVDGTYNRMEIAKYQATLNIASLKKLFTDLIVQH